MATRAPLDDTPPAPARVGWVDALRRLPARIVALPILVYRYGISPVIGQRCRFHPSCSAYGLEALGRFGALRGGWLTLARVARCHPWHPGGVEPVPDVFEPPAAARYLGRLLRDTASRPGALAGSCPCDPPRPTRDGHATPPHRS